MNKKGQLAFILITIIAFALLAGSLFSFLSLKQNFFGRNEKIDYMMKRISFLEDYAIYKSKFISRKVILSSAILTDKGLKERFQENLKKENIPLKKGLENFYGKVERGDFHFYWNDTKKAYQFNIEDVFVYSKSGAHKYKRYFSFGIDFDSAGNTIRIWKN